MDSLEPTTYLPLFNDRAGTPMPAPITATTMEIQEVSESARGRGKNAGENGAALRIPADSDFDDLMRETGYRPGCFRILLYDLEDRRLPHVGYVRVTDDHLGLDSPTEVIEPYQALLMRMQDQNAAAMNKLISIIESNALVNQQSIQTLTGCVVETQRGCIQSIEKLNASIHVASGLEVLEREPPPQLDEEALFDQVYESVKEATKKDGPPKWLAVAPLVAKTIENLVSKFAPQPPSPPPAPPAEPKIVVIRVKDEEEYEDELEEVEEEVEETTAPEPHPTENVRRSESTVTPSAEVATVAEVPPAATVPPAVEVPPTISSAPVNAKVSGTTDTSPPVVASHVTTEASHQAFARTNIAHCSPTSHHNGSGDPPTRPDSD